MLRVAGASETSVKFYRLHGATSQKADIFVVVFMRN
jgi:hypothetical protein